MNDNKELDARELIYLIVGFAIGPGFLKLPNVLIHISGQDAWISAILALIYPLYLTVISLYISNKFPYNTILEISRSLYGTLFGNLFNIIFLIQFIFISATITSDFIILMETYVAPFLSQFKIALLCALVCSYASSKGIKVLSEISQYALYMILFAMILSLYALNEGSLNNIKPMLNNDYKTIIKGSIECVYYYSGFEIITLIHPYVKDKKNIEKNLLISIVIAGSIWVWTVVITISYLGIYLAPKTNWSFILVYESIKFPIINNFRYIFMFLWIFVTFRIISNYYYISSKIISDVMKIKTTYALYFLVPVVIYISTKISVVSQHNKILNVITPITIYLNIFLITFLAITIAFKFYKKNK